MNYKEKPIQFLPKRRLLTFFTRFLILIFIVTSFYFIYNVGSFEENNLENLAEKESSLEEFAKAISTKEKESNVQLTEHINHQKLIPILVFACNRPSVSRCLNSLLQYRPSDRFPIIVSQDCGHNETSVAIDKYSSEVLHIHQPDLSAPKTLPQHREYVGYYKISRHYKWALDFVFNVLFYDQVIILEDDMEVAPDFFDYFESFLPVLRSDPTLFCVSSWNDNGKQGRVEDSKIFFRSDFFPGLGWMLTKELWKEIQPKWPPTFWDDWLRHPNQRKGRACIRPEVSRTFNFGKNGVSGGLFYDQHIGKIQLSKEDVKYTGFEKKRLQLYDSVVQSYKGPFSKKSKSSLLEVDVRKFLKENYDDEFLHQIYNLSSPINSNELRQILSSENPLEFKPYSDNANIKEFKNYISSRIFPNSAITEFDDVSSIFYCGNTCRRRFRLEFDMNDYGSFSQRLAGQVNLLAEWDLMTDIREDVARVSYLNIVAFKAKFSNPPELWPNSQKDAGLKEEYVMIYIAPKLKR